MDEKPKKRRFWQIYLSTIIAGMICAGAMLGVNLYERDITNPHGGGTPSGDFCVGWPATFVEQNVQFTWLLLDGVVAVAVLAVVAVISELVIRRRVPLRVHLSTVIFLTLIGGGFLGVNCFPHSVYVVGYSGGEGGYAYGWPFHLIDVFGNERALANVIVPEGWSMDWRGALANIAVLLLILAATANASEFLVRRREGRKP